MTPTDDRLARIQAAVRTFRDARAWRQFHSPKNLSMSIAIEAAELMEHFQWLSVDEARTLMETDAGARQAVGEELADILIYCLSLADILDYDVAAIITEKLAKNEIRYPADEFHGRFKR